MLTCTCTLFLTAVLLHKFGLFIGHPCFLFLASSVLLLGSFSCFSHDFHPPNLPVLPSKDFTFAKKRVCGFSFLFLTLHLPHIHHVSFLTHLDLGFGLLSQALRGLWKAQSAVLTYKQLYCCHSYSS